MHTISQDTSHMTPPLPEATATPGRESGNSRNSLAGRLLSHPAFHLTLLLVLVFSCFGRTLTSYFIADDFGEVRYVSRIFSGEPWLYWSNWAGNYMQIPSMNVYRPWLLTTLVIDYLIWGATAFGYYLTNLVFFSGVVVLLYLVTRRLTDGWTTGRSILTALTGAALFAASPLHCESISWVVGRVDIVSCFFYLSALWLMLASRRRPPVAVGLAVLCFWLGLLTKEMAIGLPVLLAAVGFFWPGRAVPAPTNAPAWIPAAGDMNATPTGASLPEGANAAEDTEMGGHRPAISTTFRSRIGAAVRLSAAFWISTVIYFILRFMALGTLVGGYTDGLGANQLGNMLARWTDLDTLVRLVIPLNHTVFSGASIYHSLLAASYAVALAIIGARILAGQVPWKWLGFLSVWGATAAIPIFQLWGLGYDLEGSRFYFFLTLPLSLLLPVLLLAPPEGEREYPLVSARFERRLTVLGLIALTVMVAALSRSAYATNLLWVHAGKEVRSLASAAEALAGSTAADRKLIVLGLPKRNGGAHLILNGDTFLTSIRPPFASQDLSQRFLTFEPILFGPAEYIDATRLKRSLSSDTVAGAFLWSGPRGGFQPLSLGPAAVAGMDPLPLATDLPAGKGQPHTSGHAVYESRGQDLAVHAPRSGDAVLFTNLGFSPLDYDFLELSYRCVGPQQARPVFIASWSGTDGAVGSAQFPLSHAVTGAASGTDDFRTVRLRLSRFWRWFATGKAIDDLSVQLPRCSSITMKNMRLISARNLVPSVLIANGSESPVGVWSTSGGITVRIDAGQISGAAAAELEISRPNYFFDNFSLAEEQRVVAARKRLPLSGSATPLDDSLFPARAYYQLRVRCLDSGGNPIGEYSDPITVSKL